MGYDRKYGKVTTEHGDIPDDEPVVVFRARDILSVQVLRHYAQLCEDAGSAAFHVALAKRTAMAFAAWQELNPGKPRVPSSESHRERLESGTRE